MTCGKKVLKTVNVRDVRLSETWVSACEPEHLLGCVLLLLHPGTLGDDELVAALVDDTRAHWKHRNIKTSAHLPGSADKESHNWSKSNTLKIKLFSDFDKARQFYL